jgi:hypothetical protein
VLEFLQHDSETFCTSTNFRIVVSFTNINSPRLTIFDPDQIDRGKVSDLNTTSPDFLSREQPEWFKTFRQLIVLVYNSRSVLDGERVPVVESLGRLSIISALILDHGG